MKKIIKYILPFILILLVILTPTIILEGAKSGLFLWFNALIPALMPYMIISNMVIKSGMSMDMAFMTKPLTKLLKITPSASYCILSGIFFGYPACAVNACLLIEEKQLDKRTANFCICAFNNLSPGFIMGFFCIGILEKPAYILPVFALFYISLLLSTILIRILFFRDLSSGEINTKNTADNSLKKNRQNLLTNAIKAAITNISVMGGYIIIFSIIIQYVLKIPFGKVILATPVLEITTGITQICSFYSDIKFILLILMPMLSFGGISGIFQTFGIDGDGIIDKKKYIYSKLLSGMVCFIVTYFAVYVLKIIR